MDSFLEYMIKAKKTRAQKMRQVLIWIGALISMLFVTMVFLIISASFPAALTIWPLAVAGVIFGAYKLIISYDVEYEYILTNGELDVDKITNRKKRKRLITVHSKTFTAFYIADKDDFSDKEKAFARVIDATAHSDSHTDYCAEFFKNGQKIKLIFNPTQKMIDVFKVFAPRVITENGSLDI